MGAVLENDDDEEHDESVNEMDASGEQPDFNGMVYMKYGRDFF